MYGMEVEQGLATERYWSTKLSCVLTCNLGLIFQTPRAVWSKRQYAVQY